MFESNSKVNCKHETFFLFYYVNFQLRAETRESVREI